MEVLRQLNICKRKVPLYVCILLPPPWLASSLKLDQMRGWSSHTTDGQSIDTLFDCPSDVPVNTGRLNVVQLHLRAGHSFHSSLCPGTLAAHAIRGKPCCDDNTTLRKMPTKD